ncbi:MULTISPECIES: AsmA family protein [unclassified Minwuia]|uniref:AsmA family protein n=1 Tax=unclassified Minwuia TaxID=2618799 RepID=UPI00247954C9|nr:MULTISPECIES: AsmA family protein [unclassified Minwuia]
MKRVLIAIGVILVLLVAIVIIVPFVVPTSTLVDYVKEEVEGATGRKLTVNGDPSFSIFPDVALTLPEVALSNAAGGEAADLVRIKSADIQVDLMAAISGDVVIKRFVLVEPVIAIEKDANGRFNFEFDPPAGAAAPAASGGSGEGSGGGGGDLALRLDDVRLENATFIYMDAQTGQRQELKGVNAKLSLPDFAGPFDMDASAEWQGRQVSVVAHVDRPQAIAAGQETALRLTAEGGDLFKVDFNGTATAGTAPKGAGRLTVTADKLGELLAWVGAAMGPEVKLPSSISLDANVTGSPTAVALSDAAIGFDGNRLTGAIRAGLAGARPSLFADLSGGDLDLRPYMPADAKEGVGTSDGAAAPAGASKDWSDDPIDLSGLDAADVDMHIAADSIKTGIVDTAATDIKLVSEGKRTNLTITKLGLYDGEATGAVSIDRRGAAPKFAIKLDGNGIQAQPMLQQFADFGDFLGTVELAVDMTTAGASERQIVSALNGTGALTVRDGAIIGYNLAAAVRGISTANLDLDYDEAEKTDFAEISATWTANNGVINNPDLMMNAPLLRVTGKGTVSLPPRQIDYRVLPKLVASLAGQGAKSAGGLGVPILIKGSLDDPSIQPDLEGVVRGVIEAPGDAVKGVIEGGGGAVKGLLDSVTGGGDKAASDGGTSTDGASTESSNPVEGAAKKLKGLFGTD